MPFEIVRSIPVDQWRSFVENHPNGNIFHTPEMFSVFAQTKGCKPTLIAALNQDRVPLAILLPVSLTLKDGISRYLTTRAVAYGSILCDFGTQGLEASDLLLRSYVQNTAHISLFTELRNVTCLDAVQPILGQHGFAYTDHLNYLIDLNHSPEVVFQNIGRRTRRNIRNGLHRGEVVIKDVQGREGVALCYNLLRQTYQAARMPLADISLFESAFDLLYPKGMIRFSLAYIGQNVAATSVDLLYKDVMYGWYGGTDRKYSAYIPNEILTWKLFEWGIEHGYRCYDFGGAGKPDEEYGVREFKAKFGGQLVNYGRNTCVHHKLLKKFAEIGYRLAREFLFSGEKHPSPESDQLK